MRRCALISMIVLAVCGLAPAQEQAGVADQAKRIAILANYWAARSHANAIATKFFTGYPTDAGMIAPKVQVASIFIAQPSGDDVGHLLAERFNVPVFPTIAQALTLGGDKLAVDGVLYVGQHGTYMRSRMGQRMYPHLNHLEEVFRVFEASGQSVPVYNDKELAYSWLDSKWIYDRAKELGVPMMAGSVLPLTWRRPMLQHPVGAKITEAVVVGYGGLDAYAFHTLEILQCMLERREGGETGVVAVQCLRGRDVYDAAREGLFSMALAEAACAGAAKKRGPSMEQADSNPTAILITYRDGTKAAAILTGRYVDEYWGYAANVDGETVACEFVSPPGPGYAYFSYLAMNVEKMFITGEPQYPLERTLLTSGILDTAVRSLAAGGKAIRPPFLRVRYRPFSFDPIWPNAAEPQGASLGPWPPEGFDFILPAKRTPAAGKKQ